jgi:hypothetical protein
MSLCDVQRKIQRCLAFIDAGSEHESSVAVQQAVRLCRRHGLVLTAVQRADVSNVGIPEQRDRSFRSIVTDDSGRT